MSLNATRKMSPEPTIFIVDDDEAVRDSLRWLMESVGLRAQTYSSAQAFLEACHADQSGCLLLDIRMPGMSGLDLQERLVTEGIELPVIIITGHGDVPMAVRALKNGALDFVEKPFNDQLLLDCVNRAIAEDAERRRNLAHGAALRERFSLLTPREREVLGLVVDGTPNKLIAAELGVSLKTVEAHRARVMEKLEADSLSHLVRMALALRSESAPPTPR